MALVIIFILSDIIINIKPRRVMQVYIFSIAYMYYNAFTQGHGDETRLNVV
jgi:hypothetical protein